MNKNFKTLAVLIVIGLFFLLSSSDAIFAKDKIKIKKNTETHASTETTGVVGANNTVLIEEKDITDKVLNDVENKLNNNATPVPETTKIQEEPQSK